MRPIEEAGIYPEISANDYYADPCHARIYPNVERLIELGYLKRGDPVGTLRVRLP